MDDFSTIIYIVIAIIAFVFSSKGNKKKQEQKKTTTNFQSTASLENILKEQIPQEWLDEQPQNELEDELGISPEEEGSVSNPELEPILKYSKEKEQKAKSKEKPPKKRFDARKAIIYSTIMNRKEY